MSIALGIIEDDENVISYLMNIFSNPSQVKLKAVARNKAQAIHLIRSQELDLILLDLGLPDVDGFDLMEEIKKKDSGIKVLVLTTFANPKHVFKSFKLGADGYLLKEEVREGLIDKIVQTVNGQAPVSPLISKLMLTRLNELEGGVKPQVDVSAKLSEYGLSNKEWSVLRLLAEGHAINAIGNRLAISPHTVNQHLRSIYRKLGVTTRAMAVHTAYVNGLLEP
jgi:DNA-binding NarL/FixJ family response regulator